MNFKNEEVIALASAIVLASLATVISVTYGHIY